MRKIVISLLLGFFILFASNVYRTYAFDDIEDSSTKAAVDTLARFNILNGYNDKTFRPDNNITRAEFAKIIIVATKNEVQLSDSSNFTDIPEDYWAQNYIDIAKYLGIVNGISDESFAPEDNITYEQAAKMIVAALGYDEEAKQNGGYPEGYVKIAEELGILNGIVYVPAEKATRGNIAIMIRRALDAEFYFIYNDGQGLVREKSEITLFKLHEEAEKMDTQMNELLEEQEIDSFS